MAISSSYGHTQDSDRAPSTRGAPEVRSGSPELMLARLDVVPEVGGRDPVGIEDAREELIGAVARKVDERVDVIVGDEIRREEAAGRGAQRTLDRPRVRIGIREPEVHV